MKRILVVPLLTILSVAGARAAFAQKSQAKDKNTQQSKVEQTVQPEQWKMYDSLAEVFLNDRDTINAMLYYQRSLILNPENKKSEKTLRKLEHFFNNPERGFYRAEP